MAAECALSNSGFKQAGDHNTLPATCSFLNTVLEGWHLTPSELPISANTSVPCAEYVETASRIPACHLGRLTQALNLRLGGRAAEKRNQQREFQNAARYGFV